MVKVSSFEGMTAVVTGGGSGMGREFAKQLVAEGCSVAIADIRSDDLKETVTQCNKLCPNASVQVISEICDVTNVDQIASFASKVSAAFGRKLNLLINNAGMATNGTFTKMSRERFDRTFDVSFKGVVEFTRAFLPMIVETTKDHNDAEKSKKIEAKDKVGYVINISSINAFWCCLGPANWPFKSMPHTPYSAAKAAVRGFSEALLHDSFQNFPQVGVVSVHPGFIATNVARYADKSGAEPERVEEIRALLIKNASKDRKKVIEAMSQTEIVDYMADQFFANAPTTAEEAVRYILKQVKRGSTRVLVGEDAEIVDFLSRLFPRLIYNDYFMFLVMFPWMATAGLAGKYLGLHGVGKFMYPALLSVGFTLTSSAAKKIAQVFIPSSRL